MHVRFASAESLRATRMGWFIVLDGVRDPLKGVCFSTAWVCVVRPANDFALSHARPLRVLGWAGSLCSTAFVAPKGGLIFLSQ
jgi:hypothetical protein